MSRCRLAVAAALLVLAPAAPAHGRPVLTTGSSGPAVERLEQRLRELRYLARADVDGRFDAATWHAVVAFQGWQRIGRDGAVGSQTRRALRRAQRPRPWSRRRGFEVHLDRQVLLLVNHRRVMRAIHVSTGAGGATPAGRFRVIRRERLSWSVPFQVWMPFAQHSTGGHAMHAHPQVPAYAASHGCVRLPDAEAARAWRFGRMGMRVRIGGGAA